MSALDSTVAVRDENFPVALVVLPPALRQDLWAIYRYARLVDDIGDEAVGDRLTALSAIEHDIRRLFRGEPPDHPVVRGLARTVETGALPPEPFLRLIEANRQDQTVMRYATFDDLLGYCTLSANPVGELVLHIVGRATPDRIELSDRICTALQVIEHLQDVAEDRRRGRIYLPQEDLARFGVREEDLDASQASPAVRALIAFESSRARDMLAAGAPLVGTLRGWARITVAGYVAGGRAAVSALARRGYDPLGGSTRPRRTDVALGSLRLALGGS